MLLRKIETNNNANHDYMELWIKLLVLVEILYLWYISLSDIEKSETLKIIFQNFYLDGEKASYIYKKTFNSFVEGNVCLLNWTFGTNLTLWGFLENPRTFKIQSWQEKRALEGSFSKNGGR